jgi:copper resistance protein D
MSLYHFSVSLHVLAAIVWLGGMFFFALVGAPALRAVEPPQLRMALFRSLGERFRTVGWAAIGVLMVTGIANLHFRGLLDPGLWRTPGFWSTSLGAALAWKLAAVAIMIALSALHDFVFGPAAARHVPGGPAALRSRRRAGWMARINALVGVVLVLAAVRLARGG